MKFYSMLLFCLLLLIQSSCISSESSNTDPAKSMAINKEDGLCTVSYEGKPLFCYQYGITYPPPGIDSSYQRSGYFHPIYTPNGQRLTRIQPDDHYHHYGLWNPWTRVLFEGDTIDFWNLKDRQGTVRHAKFLEDEVSQEGAQFKVQHEHIVLKNGMEKVALYETQTVKVYEPQEGKYLVDLSFTYSTATSAPFEIIAYRYQGLGWRATEVWNNENSEIITSEGKDRSEADNTVARWFIYQGQLSGEYGGMTMMSHAENRSHPEPIRVWPIDVHDGAVFANFVPTKYENWTFEPGESYTLKYRLVIFNDKMTVEQAENHWQNYNSDK